VWDAESDGSWEHVLHRNVDAHTGRGTFGVSGRKALKKRKP